MNTPTGRPNRQMILVALALLSAALLIVAAVVANRKPAGESAALSPGQVAAVEALVHDYLRDHPEVVNDALKKLVQQQRAAEEERRKLNIRALAKELKDDPGSPVANAGGDVTIVEFFDYECPYCKAMAPKLHDLIDKDKKVRFVFKEYPVLGPISDYAARAALASRNQDKYLEFHFAMMAVRGQMNEDMVLATAKEVGIDIERLQMDMTATEIDDIIKRNKRLAEGINIQGTPNFIVEETLIPGAVDISYIKELIGKARGG